MRARELKGEDTSATAFTLLHYIRQHGPQARSRLLTCFSSPLTADQLDNLLSILVNQGLATIAVTKTRGRPRTTITATDKV